MPSLQRVTTITTSSNDGKTEEKVISEVIKVADESADTDKPIEASTDMKPNTVEPASTKTPKLGSKAKKNDVPPNQRKIGSFFMKAKSQEKKAPPSITTTPKKLDSDNATIATTSSVPAKNKSKPKTSKTSTSSSNVTSQVSVTPSTSAKKEKSNDTVADIDDDIMAIVLGSHGSNSNASPNITPTVKPRSKVRGMSVSSMLPSLVVQELQADSSAAKKPSETSRVDCSSVLENVGVSVEDKKIETESTANTDPVNLLKPRSKNAPKKREAETETDTDGALAVIADGASPTEANESCSHSVLMNKSDSSTEVLASNTDSFASNAVKINTLAGRKKQKVKNDGSMQVESSTPDISTIPSNEMKSDSIDFDTSQNTCDAVGNKESSSLDVPIEDTPLETKHTLDLSEEDQALLSKFEKMSEKYISRAKELVERSTDGSLEEEPFQKDARDRKIIIPEEVNSYPITSTNEVEDDWLNCISLLIQGSPLAIDDLAKVVLFKVNSDLVKDDKFLSLEAVTSKIKLIATRTQYLAAIPTESHNPAKLDIFADTSSELMWRWELTSLDFVANDYQSIVKNARTARRKLKNHEKAVVRLLHAIFDVIDCIKGKKDDDAKQKAIAKVSSEEEKVLKYEREEEKQRLLNEAKKQKLEEKLKAQQEKEKQALEKRRERDGQEDAKRKLREQKLEEKERKKKEAAEEKLRKKNAAQALAEEKKQKQKSMMMSFFKTSPDRKIKKNVTETSSITMNTSLLKLNVVNSDDFWSEIGTGEVDNHPFSKKSCRARQSCRKRVRQAKVRVFVTSISDNPFEPQVYDEERIISIRNKYKFLCFREDYRPAYHGTWSKTSPLVTGRTPFGKDSTLDYDVDSEAEWEEGDDDEGEDCSETGNDEEEVDDEEGDITKYNYQDGWLAEDDDLDMEEDDDETKELRKKKALERVENQSKQVSSTCVIAPLSGGIPQCSSKDCPSLVFERVECLGSDASLDLWDNLECEILYPASIRLNAFPASKQDCNKKIDTTAASATPKEMSNEDLVTFVKFIHNSTLKSKDLIIEELRNTHKDITSSRKQAARKLDSIANKRFLGNGGGVIWEVKNEVLESLGLHHLIKPKISSPVKEADSKKNSPKKMNATTKTSDSTTENKKTKTKKRAKLVTISKAGDQKKHSLVTMIPTPSFDDAKSNTNEKNQNATQNDKIEASHSDSVGNSTPPKGDDRPSLVSPSLNSTTKNSVTSPLKRKAPPAPVSKASANLLAAFLKKKKTE